VARRAGHVFKRVVFAALAVVLGIVAGIALLEAGGRLFLRNAVILGLPLKDLLQVLRDIDHRLAPGSEWDINTDGIRSVHEASFFGDGDLSVVFLGDSFTYGLFLPYEETIPRVFETLLQQLPMRRQAKVANFGWTSSSPLLSLRLLRDIGAKYHPDVVVLLVDMTDFYDDVIYQNILDRKGIFRLLGVVPFTCVVLKVGLASVPAFSRLHERIFWTPARRYFVGEQPLEKSLPWLSAIRRNMDELDRYATEVLGARFVVAVLPRAYQYSSRESPDNLEKREYTVLGPYCLEPFRWFESIRASVRYPIYSLLPVFQTTTVFPTCFYDDPHYNAAGARIAAEALFRMMRADGFFVEPP
jgi:hypothetical protein